MRREVYHINPHTFSTPVLLQPVIISLIWTLTYLRKHIRQYRKSSRPKVYLKSMQVTWLPQCLLYYTLLVTHIPRKQNEHILNIRLWKVPHPIVTFDFIGIRKLNVYPSNYERFSSDFPDCWYLFAENGIDSCLLHLLENILMRVWESYFELEGDHEEFWRVFF